MIANPTNDNVPVEDDIPEPLPFEIGECVTGPDADHEVVGRPWRRSVPVQPARGPRTGRPASTVERSKA